MGPLQGLKVIELAGIGPGPMCAMLLADMGATVLRIDRATEVELGQRRPLKHNLLLRNRKSIRLDLKRRDAVMLALRLVEQADALIEGFRPGVMERLGLGPAACLARNPRLAYGRMTGWGQEGPLAAAAGHDLNYIALAGALGAIGRKGAPPTPPLNLVADYGGGALYLAFGLLAAIMHARTTGIGQVVDAAMVDGVASLMTSVYGMHAAGMLDPERGSNVNDSGAYFYDVYQCADGQWISIAPIEGRFHAELLRRLEIDPQAIGDQWDRNRWPEARSTLAARFRTRTRAEWCALLEGTDVCFAPVLSLDEAPAHPHLRARGTFIEADGVVQPAPAPRFSRTPAAIPESPEQSSKVTPAEALAGWLDAAEVAALIVSGTLAG
ncbi:MAG: CoA transferase [Betaproteobacteria bacterium]|nr:MAG: CoA transferase [Betaproteobacteria bacterium]